MGGVLFLHLVQVLSDDLIGLVPADGLKLALAALAYPLQRRLDAVLAVHVVSQRGALGAQLAVVQGVVRRTFHADDLAILHIAVHATVDTGAADGAQGVLHFNASILAGNLGFDLLFQFSQRMSLLKSR